MKILSTLALCSVLLLFSGCKKLAQQLDGTDVNYGLKQGYQYDTWVIDDDNAGHADQTKGTETYKDKKEPKIIIKKDNTYTYTYTDAISNTLVTELGSVSIDGNAKTITFHPSGKSDYTYKITCLSDENFFWVATVEKTVAIKLPEGGYAFEKRPVDETLFMEDLD